MRDYITQLRDNLPHSGLRDAPRPWPRLLGRPQRTAPTPRMARSTWDHERTRMPGMAKVPQIKSLKSHLTLALLLTHEEEALLGGEGDDGGDVGAVVCPRVLIRGSMEASEGSVGIKG